MPAHRPVVMATRHAISAGHYLAAEAGFEVLNAGGNAIDAGVAAGLALGVLHSDLAAPGHDPLDDRLLLLVGVWR